MVQEYLANGYDNPPLAMCKVLDIKRMSLRGDHAFVVGFGV